MRREGRRHRSGGAARAGGTRGSASGLPQRLALRPRAGAAVSAQLEVLDGGFGNLLQDGGRPGARSVGVPLSGAADRVLLACANLLLGNAPDAAAVEVALAGPRLRVAGAPVDVALSGALAARVLRAGGDAIELAPWHSLRLRPGDTIAVGAARGPGYLAVSGGFDVPPQLGSRSTYARAGIGGVQGRALAAGDRIDCAAVADDDAPARRAGRPFAHPAGPLRVILGPQDDAFTDAALASLLGEAFEVGAERDRMGLRLAGPRLAHRPGRGADIVSEGVAPGAVQVPGNGQPIILGPDCQTVGGYTKIATVISADLPRLAHLMPGQAVRFAAVTPAAAREALAQQRRALAAWQAEIVATSPPGEVDEAALYACNLLSGMVDARGFHHAEHLDLPWERE